MAITWDDIDTANVERAHVWHQDSTPWTVDMWLTAFGRRSIALSPR
jgi:hypothetical protein